MRGIKILFLSIFYISFIHESLAQTGPAGVGNPSINAVWYDSEFQGLTNNASVSTLFDRSGNNNNLTQTTPANQPVFLTNQLNGRPAISFNGSTQSLSSGGFAALSSTNQMSVFIVGLSSSAVTNPFFLGIGSSTNFGAIRIQRLASGWRPTFPTTLSVTNLVYPANNVYNLHSIVWNANTPQFRAFQNSNAQGTNNLANGSIATNNGVTLGRALHVGGGFLNGQIAEVIIFRTALNTTQRIIIENYLAAKYALTISNDKFSFQATHGNEVAGIGQEAPGDNHTDAQGTAIVRIQGASDLGTGEYLMWGHDGAALTGDTVEIPASFSGSGSKLTREWRADETGGDVGTVSIIFDTDSISPELGPSASEYRLLTDADGDFTNATVIMPSTWGTTITFNNVDLSTESFFTIANTGVETDCVSDDPNVSAPWALAGEWDCASFPDSTSNATVVAPHIRIVSGVQSAINLVIETGGTVVVDNNATLIIKGDMTIQAGGTLTCNPGSTVIFRGNAGSIQLINNSSGGNLAFANVVVSNPDNVRFFGGTYSISEGAHLIEGSFQNTSGLTFTSTAASQGHVARIVTGDFASSAGAFTIERFKAGGLADWNDLATAGIATTVSDIDNEIFISGVPGADGYAFATGGGGFISMYTYNNITDAYAPVTNVTNPMALGQGFETWLGDNLTTWNPKAWNFTGSSINIATSNITLDAGGTRWNLIGNPLPCFLNFSAIFADHPSIAGGEFWYYDADSSQYNSRGAGAFIPPGQGFWLNVNSATTLSINPTTHIFSDRTTSEFFKMAGKEEFKVEVKNKEIPFGSAIFLRKDPSAFVGTDEMDLAPLKVPDSRAVNMWMDCVGEESMVNYIDPNEPHLEIPLVIESGVPGEFVMNFKGISKFDEYQCINLLNEQTQEQIEISAGASYSFEIGDDLNELHFKLLLSKEDYEDCLAPTEFTDNDMRVFANGKLIVADFFLDRSAEAKIEVFNILGQPVFSQNYNVGYSRETINLENATSGIYFVNLNVNGTTQTEKVILK